MNGQVNINPYSIKKNIESDNKQLIKLIGQALENN